MHEKAKKFKKNILKQFQFEDYEIDILNAAIKSLDNYYAAQDQLKIEGLTTKSKNGYYRQHPCINISKISLANFIACLKQLKISDLQFEGSRRGPLPKKIGRPMTRR